MRYLSDMKNVLREALLERMISERFGQKIGMQPSLVGVRDERNLVENELEEDEFEEGSQHEPSSGLR